MGGDTIAAIATGNGSSALGIVRISGPCAGAVLDAVVPGTAALRKPRTVFRGTARHPKTALSIDDVLCFFAPGPRTATGEDVAEIHGHGGPVVMRSLLAAAFEAGARPAEPGEFTSRAFLTGRIDLTQAEAVMGLIGARSERAARAALRQLEGGLRERLDREYGALARIAAEIEAGLDFPDEDLPLAASRVLAERLSETAASLAALAGTFDSGLKLSAGARVALVGPPNAGKSSLFNRLAGSERALVDAEPGTTRDALEVDVVLAGVPVRLCDTAGMRAEAGRVEALGMAVGEQRARSADAVIAVVDGASGSADLVPVARLVSELAGAGIPIVVALNKSDLPGWRADRVPEELRGYVVVPSSAGTGEGCDRLVREIGLVLASDETPGEIVLSTARQHRAVTGARDCATRGARLLESGAYPEIAAEEVRAALESLSSLFGKTASEDVLDALFSSFCLGK